MCQQSSVHILLCCFLSTVGFVISWDYKLWLWSNNVDLFYILCIFHTSVFCLFLTHFSLSEIFCSFGVVPLKLQKIRAPNMLACHYIFHRVSLSFRIDMREFVSHLVWAQVFVLPCLSCFRLIIICRSCKQKQRSCTYTIHLKMKYTSCGKSLMSIII